MVPFSSAISAFASYNREPDRKKEETDQTYSAIMATFMPARSELPFEFVA